MLRRQSLGLENWRLWSQCILWRPRSQSGLFQYFNTEANQNSRQWDAARAASSFHSLIKEKWKGGALFNAQGKQILIFMLIAWLEIESLSSMHQKHAPPLNAFFESPIKSLIYTPQTDETSGARLCCEIFNNFRLSNNGRLKHYVSMTSHWR